MEAIILPLDPRTADSCPTLEALANGISACLDVDWAIVAFLVPGRAGWVSISALSFRGKAAPAFSFSLRECGVEPTSPGEAVFRAQHGIPSLSSAPYFAGLVLDNPDGAAVLLAVCHCRPIVPAQHTALVLQLAARLVLLAEASREPSEEHLARLFHDPVTGLRNRTSLLAELDHAIELSGLDPRHFFAVLHLNLDRFHLVHQAMGDAAGEELVKLACHRLTKSLTPLRDRLFSLGPGEFAIVMEGISSENDALALAERIRAAFLAPFDLDPLVVCAVFIGLTFGRGQYATARQVISDSSIALRHASSGLRGSCRIYDHLNHDHLLSQLRLEEDIRRALQSGEFDLFYQPIHDIRTKALRGVEALLRWRHPVRGLLLPEDFLDEVDKLGLMMELGRWTLQQASRQMREWRSRRQLQQGVFISVNLSQKQFSSPALLSDIASLLQEHNLGPNWLRLELLETLITEEADAVAARLDRKRKTNPSPRDHLRLAAHRAGVS